MAGHAHDIGFDGNGAHLRAHLAVPDAGSGPGLVLIPDVRGLSDHYRDVAGRFARQGFVTLVIDLYSREGAPDLPDMNAVFRWMAALPDARILGDLGVRVSFHVEQYHRQAAPLGQLEQGGPQPLTQGAPLGLGVGSPPAAHDARLERLGTPDRPPSPPVGFRGRSRLRRDEELRLVGSRRFERRRGKLAGGPTLASRVEQRPHVTRRAGRRLDRTVEGDGPVGVQLRPLPVNREEEERGEYRRRNAGGSGHVVLLHGVWASRLRKPGIGLLRRADGWVRAGEGIGVPARRASPVRDRAATSLEAVP